MKILKMHIQDEDMEDTVNGNFEDAQIQDVDM
jgi:hypothetical protein